MSNNLKIGNIVEFDNNSHEIVIDIYDSDIFHSIDKNGSIMQYNTGDITNIVSFVDISNEINAIVQKLKSGLVNLSSFFYGT